MSTNIGVAVFTLAMAIVCAVVAWWMMLTHKKNMQLFKASAAWPTVTGVIDAAAVEVHTDTTFDSDNNQIETNHYEPKVAYRYTVGGRELAGSRINFAPHHFASEKKAKAVIAPYAVGASVVVAYDPADSRNSVLDRETRPSKVSLGAITFWVSAAILLVVGLVLLAVGG